MLLRRLPMFGLACGAIAAIVGACGDDQTGAPTRPDSGAPQGALGESVCPAAAPRASEACDLPEGTTCSFGACGSSIAECRLGSWRYSGNPTPRPPCPTDFPASDSVCPPCWPDGVECTYGSSDCSAADASANTTIASCVDGGADLPQRWRLRSFPCAVVDAGADVQGDAEPDAD